MRTVVLESECAVEMGDDNRLGQEWLEDLFDRDRSGTGASAAVRRGERLMQVEVHHVHSEVSRTNFTHERVHVGAVHVKESALGVEDVGDLVDVLFEYAECVGVGQHQGGDIFVHLRFQRGDVDHAAGVGLQVFDSVAHHGSGGWVRAMGGIGNQN